MKEAPIHRSSIQHTQCSAIRIGQNGLAAKLGNNLLETCRDFVERFVPGYALPDLCGTRALARDGALRGNPPHRIQHTIRRVHPVEIFRYFGAKKATGYRMGRIALDFRSLTILYRDEHTAGIRTIVRASGMNNSLHVASIIPFLLKPEPYAGNQKGRRKAAPKGVQSFKLRQHPDPARRHDWFARPVIKYQAAGYQACRSGRLEARESVDILERC